MGRKTLWHGDKLARLKKDYDNHALSLNVVALRNDTDIGSTGRLAALHGWLHRNPYRTKALRGAHRAAKVADRVIYLEKRIALDTRELVALRAGLAPKRVGYIPH